jgi:hypothetical protein
MYVTDVGVIRRIEHTILVGKDKGRDHLKVRGVNGRIFKE